MTSTGSGPEPLRRREALGLMAVTLATACSTGDDMRHDRPNAADADANANANADTGAKVLVDGTPIHFVDAGAGAPVVLIHGASGNLRDWSASALPAIARTHRVIAIDRPGHGLSGWPGPAAVTLSEQARLMRGLLGRLGIERAVVVGHSYGGSVALAWALDAPETVEGLVLVSAPSQVWRGGLGLSTDLLASPLTGPLLAQTLPAVLPRSVVENAADRVFAPQTPPPGYVDALRLDLVLRPQALRANATQLATLKGQLGEMVPRYPHLTMPVELIHGDADTTVPLAIHSEPLARQLPQARLTRLPGVGHMPHHVAAPELLAAIDRAETSAAN